MNRYKFSASFRLEKNYRKDGEDQSQNCKIMADVTFSCKRFKYFIGYRVDEKAWISAIIDGERVQKIRRNYVNRNGISASIINCRIKEVDLAIHRTFQRLELNGIPPTLNNVREQLRKELNEDFDSRHSLIEYYKRFIEQESELQTWTKGTIVKHNTILSHLKSYKRISYFEDVTLDWLNGFVHYLIYDKDLSNPTVTRLLKDFKWFLNWATKKGLNYTFAYKDFCPKLKGTSTSDKTNIITLTMEEYLTLYNMQIDNLALDQTRDVFCFCAATSLRYSDAKNLKWSNVRDNSIHIVTIKTDDPIVIYLNRFSKNIIQKYRNYKDYGEEVLPVISNQKYNDHLKELCKMAGFDEMITKVTYKGSERIETTLPKYEFITSHVARKTFVTIALYLGIPADVVRSFTGHKDAKVMERYLKFNPGQKEHWMKKFDFRMEPKKNKVPDNVFDFDINDEEKSLFGVPATREAYFKIVGGNKDLCNLHLAYLFHHRGNSSKSMSYVSMLPDEMKAEFLDTISKK